MADPKGKPGAPAGHETFDSKKHGDKSVMKSGGSADAMKRRMSKSC
jgi:hypothetical protein